VNPAVFSGVSSDVCGDLMSDDVDSYIRLREPASRIQSYEVTVITSDCRIHTGAMVEHLSYPRVGQQNSHQIMSSVNPNTDREFALPSQFLTSGGLSLHLVKVLTWKSMYVIHSNRQ
jgi:hypothetical protein